MGRWTPTVLPEAPRLAPMFDIGGALEEIAGGIRDYKGNKRREAAEQKADDRYYAEKNERAIERYKADQRQAGLDKIAAEDRQRRNERDYLDTKGRAADDGYVTGADRAERQGMARTLKAGGGLAGVGIGDALLAASSGEEALTLTRPDNAQETLYRDPTRTKEARDENQWRARQTYLDRMKPAPADPVANELREYRGKLDIDREYKINDFAPRSTGNGRGGGGGASAASLTIADKMYDNARAMESQLEREKPTAPVFDPITRSTWAKDSIKIAGAYDTALKDWTGRKKHATDATKRWFSIGDSLAREAVGASGGDAIATGRQLDAQVRIRALQARVNDKLAETHDDPAAQDRIRQWYADEVQAINQTYGIRPNED